MGNEAELNFHQSRVFVCDRTRATEARKLPTKCERKSKGSTSPFSEEEKLRNLDMSRTISSNPCLFILFYRFSACRKVKWYSVHRFSFSCYSVGDISLLYSRRIEWVLEVSNEYALTLFLTH